MADRAPPIIADPGAVTAGAPVIHRGDHARILFGPGAIDALPSIVDELGAARVAVLCTPDRTIDGERVIAALRGRPVTLHADAVMHSPVEVSDRVAGLVAADAADLLVSIGGGSSIGLGKAIALRTGLRHVALPTTYAGSELTPILGETAGGEKRTMRDDALRPAAVLYDPELGRSLPPRVAAASGMNALAHAVEALYMTTPGGTIAEAAGAAIARLVNALPAIVAAPGDAAARAEALYGSWLAGYCLAEAPMALHHKLCHALGGAFDLPHAETHAVVLPYALAFNAPAIPAAYAALRPLLAGLAGDPAEALFRLTARLGLATSLESLGLPEDGIAEVARLACANAYANPRPFDEADIARLLAAAWAGTKPLVEVEIDA